MTKVRVGIDCVEINRFESEQFKKESFLSKIYTENEINYCISRNPSSQHFAVRFAAKEAVKKCLECPTSVPLNTIEIISKGSVPEVRFTKPYKFPKLEISLTHSDNFAIAIAVALDSLD